MTLLASIVVVACGLTFVGLTGLVFTRRALAERFLMSFASSARTHYLEMAFRLVMGASLVVLSPEMWQPNLFQLVGWVIIATSFVLILLPWQWHNRLRPYMLPTMVRHLRLYAAGMLAFGALLLYGVFAGSRGAA